MGLSLTLVEKKARLASDVHDIDVFDLRGCQEVSSCAPVYRRHVIT